MAQKVGEFEVRMMYKKELMNFYNVGYTVFCRMVETTKKKLKEKKIEFDFPEGKAMLSIDTVKKFVEHNGEP